MKLNKKLTLAVAGAVLAISSQAFAAVDFMNDDAPFKTDINIAGHNGDVQLYGIIDIGYMTVNHSVGINRNMPNNYYPYSIDAANAGFETAGAPNTGRQSNFINGGMQDSRFGLKGGIDLFGAGDTKFKMIYQLEAGFNPLNGALNDANKALAANNAANCPLKKDCSVAADSSLNGDLFARQAWAGIDGGNLGKVSYGIQYNPFYEITGKFDPNQKSDSFSPLGESGAIGGGGGISANSRMKNSLKYANTFEVPAIVGEKGKLNVGTMYQFGNNVDTDYGRGYALNAGYETSMVAAAVAYNNFTDSVKADTNSTSASNPLKFGLYDTDAFIATLKITPTKEVNFSGGYQWMTLNVAKDNSIPYGSIQGYSTADGSAAAGTAAVANNSSKGPGTGRGDSQDIDFWWVGGEYNFGERFPVLHGLKLSAAYYKTDVGALYGDHADAAAGNYIYHINTETAILDYTINKRFDIYAAATWNQFGGNYFDIVKPTQGVNKDVDAYGLGVRMKF